jgi:hypothetical protein
MVVERYNILYLWVYGSIQTLEYLNKLYEEKNASEGVQPTINDII